MERYLLFAGDWYYPGGGMEDFVCSDDNLENIRTKIPNRNPSYFWWHIYDAKHGEIIEQSTMLDNSAQ